MSAFDGYKTESLLTVQRTLTTSGVESYERDGYLAFGKVLTPTGLEAMREQCMAAWNQAGYS